MRDEAPEGGRQVLDAELVDDEQVGLGSAGQGTLGLGDGGIGLELTDQVKNGDVEDGEAGLGSTGTQGLSRNHAVAMRSPSGEGLGYN